MSDDRFGQDVHAFAQELGALLNACVKWAGQGSVKITTVNGDGRTRAVVEIVTSTGSRNVPVLANGEPSAALVVRVGCRPDSSGRYLAVTESALAVYSTIDRTPLFRLEYRDDMRSAPSSHWQVHAERGALSVVESAHLGRTSASTRPIGAAHPERWSPPAPRCGGLHPVLDR
jgi:hypothetical protein